MHLIEGRPEPARIVVVAQERGTGAGSCAQQTVAIIADIAGPAAHEGPGKGGGREGSEDGQIDLGMPDVQWHGDGPLGWGATDRAQQNMPRQSGSPSFWLH